MLTEVLVIMVVLLSFKIYICRINELYESSKKEVEDYIVAASKKSEFEKLMDAFIDECRHSGMQQVDLGVYNKNTGSYNFYIEYGFEPIEQKMRIDLD